MKAPLETHPKPEAWQIGRLRLRPRLVFAMAVNSLRLRISRTLLTVLTIATASAFLIFLLTLPAQADPAEREGWLLMLGLCLLVSMAGVLNTMLMSITQRYREIGTIKCLGALDGFVLGSVMVEAALLGLVGAGLGLLAGTLLALGLGVAEFGGAAFAHLRFDGFAWKAGLALLTGLLLTTLGAALPAWIASKMPPMEAMRGEK
ncbi:MAG: ABC transporter permease [Puniceicoccaceae bacterium]|nr:MAG: ABC transporter permease [Puniceicoccaceae bacterium]